jgi:hypothetical protein
MKIIVGSTALQYFGLSRRTPVDIDTWVSSRGYKVVGDCKVIPTNIMQLIPVEDGRATPDAIYTIKCSHLGWHNPMWNKHKTDILYLKSKGCQLIPELYKTLVNFWKDELGSKDFLSLNKNKDSFFTDEVAYKYDHDWLHELVAFPNEPMYTKCLVEGEDILIDKDKFDLLSFEQQVRMFREEITVIAIERWVVYDKVSWFKAHNLSLQKTITNLTKNWATDFIILNLDYFIKPDYAYFEYALNVLTNEEI